MGGSASVHAGIPPPGTRHPPTPWDQTPQDQTPPWDQTPPRAEYAGRYGQPVGGMHPTGMHSCFSLLFSPYFALHTISLIFHSFS